MMSGQCYGCANRIPRPDGTVDFLCAQDCMVDGSCECYRPARSSVQCIETRADGPDSDVVTVAMTLSGSARTSWYQWLRHGSDSFVLDDPHLSVVLKRREGSR